MSHHANGTSRKGQPTQTYFFSPSRQKKMVVFGKKTLSFMNSTLILTTLSSPSNVYPHPHYISYALSYLKNEVTYSFTICSRKWNFSHPE